MCPEVNPSANLSDGLDGEPFGWELQLDLYGCRKDLITSSTQLQKFVTGLLKLIDMKAFGTFECPHFGHTSPKTSGYSFKQWVETSLVSGHISEARGSLYLNVFSCKFFDQRQVEDYALLFFHAKDKRSAMRTRW